MTATKKRRKVESATKNDVEARFPIQNDRNGPGNSSAGTSNGEGSSAEKAPATEEADSGSTGWKPEELLTLVHEISRTALLNIPKIASAEGLKAKSGSGGAAVNTKMRAVLKKLEKDYGGDGTFVASIRLAPPRKKKD